MIVCAFQNDSKTVSPHYITPLLLLGLLFVLSSCNRLAYTSRQLDIADSLMEIKPDSALSILNNISSTDCFNDKTKARYALLKSMALDKNCIDTTTYDVLQPAIDYYLNNGNMIERMRTQYYQGRIFQNKGDDDEAMQYFTNICSQKGGILDNLILAHAYVARATIYFKQYKIKDYIHCNLEAAKSYHIVGKKKYEIKSYSNALDGYIIDRNKAAADSLMAICSSFVNKHHEGMSYLLSSYIIYLKNFGTKKDIEAFIKAHQNTSFEDGDAINIANVYSRIGEYDNAYNVLSNVEISPNILDSLHYLTTKYQIAKDQNDNKKALELYQEYSAMHGRYIIDMLSKKMQFAEERHAREKEYFLNIQEKDRMIKFAFLGIIGLLLIVSWAFRETRQNKIKRITTDKENKALRIKQNEIRNDKVIVEKELSKFKQLTNELKKERDNIKKLLDEQKNQTTPIRNVIKKRFDVLNALLAKEITQNKNYAKPYEEWLNSIWKDKVSFMDSNRLALAASYPKMMAYFEKHNLSTEEINYLCLYALGLRGKEIGEFMQLKRHYTMSSEIRKKLGIDSHDTNIGNYVRKLMEE